MEPPLTPQEHIERADRALATALELRDKLASLDGMSLTLSPHFQNFLTSMQIVNLHANMASAKALVLLLESGVIPVPSTESDFDKIKRGVCPVHDSQLVEGRCPVDGLRMSGFLRGMPDA